MYRGTTLALVGVSNGAIQFMAYEQMKWLCFQQKRRQVAAAGRKWTAEDELLVRIGSIPFCAEEADEWGY